MKDYNVYTIKEGWNKIHSGHKHEERLAKLHAYYQANKEKIKEQRRKRYRIQKYGDEH